MLTALLNVILLGIAAGTGAFTLAKASIFVGFRMWVADHNKWLGKLVQCPYCVSHWTVLIAVAIYRPRIIHLAWVLDMGVAWLVATFIATLTWGTIMRQMKVLV